jgi:hypothetical protein
MKPPACLRFETIARYGRGGAVNEIESLRVDARGHPRVPENLDIRERELRDRKGYKGSPTESAELSGWESEAIWPAE